MEGVNPPAVFRCGAVTAMPQFASHLVQLSLRHLVERLRHCRALTNLLWSTEKNRTTQRARSRIQSY